MTKYQSRVVQLCLSIPTVLCFSSTKLPSNSPFLNKIDQLDNKQNHIRDVNFRLNPYNIIRDNLFSLNISPPDSNANNEISTPSSGNNIQHHTSLFSSRVETPGEENKGNFFAIANDKTTGRQFDVQKLSEFNSLLMSSPLFCWFEDITNAFPTMIHIPDRPIPSEQKQLPLHLRVAKVSIYNVNESFEFIPKSISFSKYEYCVVPCVISPKMPIEQKSGGRDK